MIAAIPASGPRVAWALMFYAGLRISEVIALDWSDANWRTKRVRVRVSKSEAGEDREVPMPDALRSILRAHWGAGRVGPVVPGVQVLRADAVTIRRNGHRAWKRLGLPIISPHEARHTYASWLVASNHTLPEIRDLIGHANVRVTAAYVHTLPDPRESRLNRLDAFLNAVG